MHVKARSDICCMFPMLRRIEAAYDGARGGCSHYRVWSTLGSRKQRDLNWDELGGRGSMLESASCNVGTALAVDDFI